MLLIGWDVLNAGVGVHFLPFLVGNVSRHFKGFSNPSLDLIASVSAREGIVFSTFWKNRNSDFTLFYICTILSLNANRSAFNYL